MNELVTNLGNMPQLESIDLHSELPALKLPMVPFTLHRTHPPRRKCDELLTFFTKLTYPSTTIV